MAHIVVTHMPGVSRQVAKEIVDKLFTQARRSDLIRSQHLDVYSTKLRRSDRQRLPVMVRIYADPLKDFRSSYDVQRAMHEIRSMLTDEVSFESIGLELVTVIVTACDLTSAI